MAAAAAFLSESCAYVALSTALQAVFYRGRAQDSGWRCQPSVRPHAPDGGAVWNWGLPALALAGRPPPPAEGQQARHPRHAAYATLNLLASSACCAFTAAAALRGGGTLTTSCDPAGCAAGVARGLLLSLLLQSALEYPWRVRGGACERARSPPTVRHYAMHTPALYKRFHRHHHFYKSPQVWDDLCIHPLEALGCASACAPSLLSS